MKLLLFLWVIATTAFLINPAFCFDKNDYHISQLEPQESQLSEHRHYVNKDHNVVHSPAHSVNGLVPVGAVAKCGDSSYSFSRHARGTCSHHGGVMNWLEK